MAKLMELVNVGQLTFAGETAASINRIVDKNSENLRHFNSAKTEVEKEAALQALFDDRLPVSSTVIAPFQSDFGDHIFIGENVFINRDCLFVDLGGIVIEDNVLIGPRASLISVNHVEKPDLRRNLVLKQVTVKKGAWIGSGATILPGVTIGENAIVGAGAVVTKDVAANMIVAGVPAKEIRKVKVD